MVKHLEDCSLAIVNEKDSLVDCSVCWLHLPELHQCSQLPPLAQYLEVKIHIIIIDIIAKSTGGGGSGNEAT